MNSIQIDPDIANKILTHMDGGVVSVNMAGQITTFNPAASRILGYSPEQVIGRSFAEVFMDDDRNDDFSQTMIDAIYQTDMLHERDTIYFRTSEDVPSYLNIVTSFIWSDPMPDRPRERRGVIAVFSDITGRKEAEAALAEANRTLEQKVIERTAELAAANEELKTEIAERKAAQDRLAFLANHDGLTGLANRTLFEKILTDSMDELTASRGQDGLAVLYFDLDGFKKCNDTLGHAFGDWLLIQVSKRLTNTLRDGDTPARLGGDEFCAIVRGDVSRGALEGLVGRINTAINRPYVDDNGKRGEVGVSVGIAEYPICGDSPDKLVISADKAMYAAKRAGKRTHRFYTDLPDADK